MRRAVVRLTPGNIEMPSSLSSFSAWALRRRIAVVGGDWSWRHIWVATSRPYSLDQRSTSHCGWDNSLAMAPEERGLTTGGAEEHRELLRSDAFGLVESLRRTAFTKAAAERFRA